METLERVKLTRQDYDDLFDAWSTPGDLRNAVSAMYTAVEGIVSRHLEAGQ
jgi:hypothetical protein